MDSPLGVERGQTRRLTLGGKPRQKASPAGNPWGQAQVDPSSARGEPRPILGELALAHGGGQGRGCARGRDSARSRGKQRAARAVPRG